MTTPKMRTIKEAYSELKALDSQTAITEHHIRSLVNNRKIPVVRAGNKQLIDLNQIFIYLSNPPEENTITYGVVRSVV